ncbi:hypothetical protein V8F20_004418 [Naviculisporaceae sp. PSN 640]
MGPSKAGPGLMTRSEEDYEIQRLQQLCLPRWYDRIYSTVVRPERPEFAQILKGQEANPHWTTALRTLQRTISSYSCSYPVAHPNHPEFHRPKGRWQAELTPMDVFFEDLWVLKDPDWQAKPVLRVLALILYDQECAGRPPLYRDPERQTVDRLLPKYDRRLGGWPFEDQRACRGFTHLVEHMLLFDYGIGTFPLRKKSIPHLLFMGAFSQYLTRFAQQCWTGPPPAFGEWLTLLNGLYGCDIHCGDMKIEVALALYYFQTHRGPVTRKDLDQGYTGYTGIMQELVDEIPTRGPDRLLRKLSVDVQMLIPLCCRYRYWAGLITAAEALAKSHGLEIRAPKVKLNVEIPAFDMTHRDGYPKERRRPGLYLFDRYYLPSQSAWFQRLYQSSNSYRTPEDPPKVEYSDRVNAKRLAAAKKKHSAKLERRLAEQERKLSGGRGLLERESSTKGPE